MIIRTVYRRRRSKHYYPAPRLNRKDYIIIALKGIAVTGLAMLSVALLCWVFPN